MGKRFGGEKFNKEARIHEGKIFEASQQVVITLKKIFPKIQFDLEKILKKEEIAKVVNPRVPYKPQSDSFIKPDGGFIYMTFKETKYPILISEAKKQGTNDKRISEGKKKQAKGNAIERSCKNVAEARLFCKNLDYFPYIIFAYGCDLKEGSSILDRMDVLTLYEPRNVDYTLHTDQKATVYVQENPFTYDFIYDKMLKISIQIVNHIMEKINDKKR